MRIYLFYTEADTPSGLMAFPSLEKAKSKRAEMYSLKDRPEIMRVTVPDRPTKKDVCNLLMQRHYAITMEDIA